MIEVTSGAHRDLQDLPLGVRADPFPASSEEDPVKEVHLGVVARSLLVHQVADALGLGLASGGVHEWWWSERLSLLRPRSISRLSVTGRLSLGSRRTDGGLATSGRRCRDASRSSPFGGRLVSLRWRLASAI